MGADLMAPAAPPVILASGSATRAGMLHAAGLAVERRRPAVDEDEVKASCRAAGLEAAEAAEMLAELKAQRISLGHAGPLVIGADQMLECDGRWFDKPADRAAAAAQLAALSGRRHRLISAVVVVQNGERQWHHVDQASLVMRRLSPAFIDAYLDAEGEAVCDTVGAYRLEGRGAQLFARVEGDFFTILGLPLLPLLDYLRGRGALLS